VSRSYERMAEHGRRVLAKARLDDPSISDREYRAFLAHDLFGAACFCLTDEEYSAAWRYLSRAFSRSPGMVLARPRRWGVMALAPMSRAAFSLDAGAPFDSLI
jgi:hypothetical protein